MPVSIKFYGNLAKISCKCTIIRLIVLFLTYIIMENIVVLTF